MEPTVHIYREAFLNLIISSVETFKRECCGDLFGYPPNKRHNHFLITNSIPNQCANRTFSSVEAHKRSSKRLSSIFINHPYLFRKVGEFHSHTENEEITCSEKMSDEDIEALIKRDDLIEIIVKISSRKKGSAPWTTEEDGSIKGSLKGYNFHVNVYTINKKEENPKPVKLKIVASTALKALNRALGYKT